MTVRFTVVRMFQLTGMGPTAVGILEEGDVPMAGTTLHIEATGTPVRIRSFDLHTRQTPAGLQVGLFLHPEDASMVSPGSVLVSPKK